jgi:Cu+-exporting ATPase
MENCSVLKDPVCGMTVTNKSFHHLEQGGQSHYFCGAKCKARFAANLARYATPGVGEPVALVPVAAERLLPAHFGWMLSAGAVVVLLAVARWLA